ncbi:protein Bcp1p [Trichomonascus vanleenenianus]|uniref:protein-transporting protein BCP1 n=1 Tax=Trichomonascus vanleenenianus TaxID=2268995 RepID=UPI003ECAD174
MSKKRELEEAEDVVMKDHVEDEEEEDDEDFVQVDFDFFDPKEIDFHAIKNLLRQLFDADNELFDLSSLADLILDKSCPGTTIKVGEEDTDPYALFSVINMHEHREKPAIKTLVDYFIKKTGRSPEFNRKLRRLFMPSSDAKVGLLICERVINMPVELVPPLYKIYSDDLEAEKGKGERPEITHYIIVSRCFTEEEAEIDKEDQRPSKKVRPSSGKETFYFHAEDELTHKIADYHATYDFTNQSQNSDSKRAFQLSGIRSQGHLILLSAENLPKLVANIADEYPAPA